MRNLLLLLLCVHLISHDSMDLVVGLDRRGPSFTGDGIDDAGAGVAVVWSTEQ